MAIRIFVFTLVCALFAAAAQSVPGDKAGPEVPTGYRIGAGDILQITVWKEPEASAPSITVRPDGKISLPVIKEIDALGLTPAELEKRLADRLERYIRGAEVTVVVREIRSRKIYMVGAVRKEGPVRLDSPLTVLQALNEAGGLTEFAKRKKIYVLRNGGGGAQRFAFNYDAVLRGEGAEQNILLEPGDTVVVPQ